MISTIKLGRTGFKLRYRYQHWSEDFQYDFNIFNRINQIAGDVTEKRPCGRMVAPIHQCCTFLAAFETYHHNEHRAKNVSSQCNQYICFALHVATKSIPYGRRPLPFDNICVHWPKFSSGQNESSLLQLQDRFGVKQLTPHQLISPNCDWQILPMYSGVVRDFFLHYGKLLAQIPLQHIVLVYQCTYWKCLSLWFDTIWIDTTIHVYINNVPVSINYYHKLTVINFFIIADGRELCDCVHGMKAECDARIDNEIEQCRVDQQTATTATTAKSSQQKRPRKHKKKKLYNYK